MIATPVSSPQPLQRLIRPMLLASIALHSLVFMIPTSGEVPPPEEDKISLTQLPTTESPVAASPRPTPTVRATPTPRPSAPPRVQRQTGVPPIAPVRSLAPAAAPPAAAPPAAAPSPPPAPPADAFTDGFPLYPGAVSGSFGLPPEYSSVSLKTNDAMAAVAQFFDQQLSKAGYQVEPIEQATRTAYRLTKAGVTKFLTLIPNEQGAGTSYLITDQQLPQDLGSVTVVTPEVERFYAEMPVPLPDYATNEWQEVSLLESLLDNPTAFYTSLGGVDNEGFDVTPEPRAGFVRAVVGNGDPTAMFNSLAPQLEGAQYVPIRQGEYGGGTVYELSRPDPISGQAVTGYLVLVPTRDRARTVIFVWDRRPQ